MSDNTIVAVATPNAVGGISVIRISGENAFEVADRVFISQNNKIPSKMEGYTCAYGNLRDTNGEIIDDVVLTVFKAPKSYTGENVVEISCHGGVFITRQILRIILKNGAILAEAGEFTKRAFLNGKLSLNQAEAVMNLISAKSSNELKYASALRDEKSYQIIKDISSKILSVLGSLSVWADYPDEDIPEVTPEALKLSLSDIIADMEHLSKSYDYGRIIREGINTAIVGRPNVGKSTLMNCLSGFERSIVTDIAGTTRDVIEESVNLGELTLRLSDTAGIRSTTDKIEEIGVDIAYKRLEQSDLVLAVFDSTQIITDEDMVLIERLKSKKSIAIINKSDEVSVIDKDIIKDNFKYSVEISAKNFEGIDELSNCLNEMFLNEDIEEHNGVIANERQKLCLDNSYESIKNALSILEYGENLDAVTVVLDEALAFLFELTGERITNAVVDEVFSRFCVGK